VLPEVGKAAHPFSTSSPLFVNHYGTTEIHKQKVKMCVKEKRRSVIRITAGIPICKSYSNMK